MPDQMLQRITALETKINHYEKILEDNGTEGLIRRFNSVEKDVKDMHEDLQKIASAMSGLERARTDEIAIDKEKAKNTERRSRAYESVGKFVAIIGGILGAIYLILDHISQ